MTASLGELLYNTFIEPREKRTSGKSLVFGEATQHHEGDAGKTGEPPKEDDYSKKEKELSLKLSSEVFPEKESTVERKEKLGHRRQYANGNVTYKKIQTTAIKESIQLGIRRSVGAMAEIPERDVLMVDFMAVETTSFASDDSNEEFAFKTYAPVAFRHFRDMFGIKPDAFVSSFCDTDLSELPNPGASGSVFYRTHDDHYVVKTVQRGEAWFLQKLLPGYYLNLHQNPRTLLPKFFGLYCCKRRSKNVRTIVTNNVLPTGTRIHAKFDLKGSTHGRSVSDRELEKESPTFKDLDFLRLYPDGLFLDKDVYEALVRTIKRDCRVLESFQIMDYSLLLGVHEVNRGRDDKVHEKEVHKEEIQDRAKSVDEGLKTPNGDGQLNQDHQGSLEPEQLQENSVSPQNHDNETPKLEPIQDIVVSPPHDAVFPSRTSLFDKNRAFEGLPAKLASGEDLLLFVGIIDILQSYRLKKRLEHAFKSLVHEGSSISVSDPAFYSRRFQEFMTEKVFKESPFRYSTRRKKEEKTKGGKDE